MGLLRPLPVADSPWTQLSADFVVDLPPSNGYNAILVVVDRFTKMATFIPTTTKCTAEEFATLFFKNVYCKHGMPVSLVTDRGSLFTSRFWTSLAKTTQLEHRFSTAYHPQTDGQTEVVNQWMEQDLRLYINLEQNDWADLLPHAEFCYNTTTHSTTGVSPFEAYIGTNPRNTFTEEGYETRVGLPKAATTAARMAKLHDALRRTLEATNTRYATQYNKHRSPKTFDEEDLVLLRTKNMKSMRPSKKLDDRWTGPYRIARVINANSYELDIPGSRKHRVYNITSLKRFTGDTQRTKDNTAQLYLPEDNEMGPEKVLRRRVVRGQKYLTKWYNDAEIDATWETDDTMKDYSDWISIRNEYTPKRRKTRTPSRPGWKGYAEVPIDPTESDPSGCVQA
jgi:transposase InsO family protein